MPKPFLFLLFLKRIFVGFFRLAFHFGGCSFDFFKKEERTYGKL